MKRTMDGAGGEVETVETVSTLPTPLPTSMKRGVNEREQDRSIPPAGKLRLEFGVSPESAMGAGVIENINQIDGDYL